MSEQKGILVSPDFFHRINDLVHEQAQTITKIAKELAKTRQERDKARAGLKLFSDLAGFAAKGGE